MLLRFLQTDEWFDITMRIVGNQPSRKSLAARWITTVKSAIPQLADKNLSVFSDGITKGYAQPNAVFRYDEDIRPGIQDAINRTVVNNQAPVADTIRTAVAAANATLKRLAAERPGG